LISADAILVLDHGVIQDIGRHEELLKRCDIYSSLWHQQTHHVTAALNTRDKPTFRAQERVS
jgi:ATP-binding cassette subfamily B protein